MLILLKVIMSTSAWDENLAQFYSLAPQSPLLCNAANAAAWDPNGDIVQIRGWVHTPNHCHCLG